MSFLFKRRILFLVDLLEFYHRVRISKILHISLITTPKETVILNTHPHTLNVTDLIVRVIHLLFRYVFNKSL